ncbi:IS66 family insertion sequence element accessory protein TnpB [Spongiibacter tropicus]|uniref:IS66 family insertion sequence element accessory protein TnpB n=1 Tax=Spongiibacter tropicus TaxID=454602 RepID=UPI0035BE59CC
MRPRYLRPALEIPSIYLYRDPVDFRKQAQGLAVLVEQELGHNPFDGALYVFRNRRGDKIKCLLWEDNGFVLYYKALAEEVFKWPRGEWPRGEWPRGDKDVLSLSGQEINWLLDGYDLSLMQGHKVLHYQSVS